MKQNLTALAALLAAGLALSPAASFAQTATNQPGQDANPGEAAQGQDDAQNEMRAPVLHVTSVEIIRSSHGPVLDIIRVRGVVSTQGWEEAELVPLTRGTPNDGMLDLAFIARAPGGAVEATGFEVVEAIFPLETNHPYKGIRVHSGSGAVALTNMPGYADGETPTDDCAKCVGKYFIAKGASLPSGVGEDQAVHEEKLPAKLRIIKASGGLDRVDSDPNRLTLVVGDDGKIVTAFWD